MTGFRNLPASGVKAQKNKMNDEIFGWLVLFKKT